jgi:hypothetical protein
MEYFLLEHPSEAVVLCDRPKCERVADYLELDGNRESHVCASHTTSDKYVCRLPERRPNPGIPFRARSVA